MRKHVLSVILVICMIFSSVPVLTITSSAAEVVGTGNCGNFISYILYDNGQLIISGTGKMTAYYIENSPFFSDKRIKSVKIEPV